ncbi:hypothetical protein TWF506_005779 [Arthrobotrys conoides]|uniref:Uncharacterized protein n=1 Tax=Arthrobotrys conoides TaxID=74498 RepID=A0AAN8NCN7_9PEZI
MRGFKCPSVASLLLDLHSFFFTISLLLFLFVEFSASQHETITETVFEIVQNPVTITSYLTGDGGCLILPTCLIINASAIFPSRTSTDGQSSTGTATTTAIATYTGQPDTGFVLYGDGDLRDHYMQFDDSDGRLEFALTGQYRFVQLEVNDGGTGLLQNGLNPAELVFLRYNESVRDIYPTEDAEVLDVVREVRHANENDLLASDYMGTWAWNDTDNQLGLIRDGDRWVFYVGIGSQLRLRQIPADRGSYDVFAIPENMLVSSDSSFKRLSLGAGVASDFPSSIFTQSPTGAPTGSTADISSQTTGINTSGTGTNGSGSGTGTVTGGGTGTASGSGTSGRSGTGTITSDSRTATGSNGSINTGTATRTGTGTQTGTGTGTRTGTGTGTGGTGTETGTGTGTEFTGTGTGTGGGTGTSGGTGTGGVTSTGTGTGTGTGGSNTGTGTGTGSTTAVTAIIYNIITSNNLEQYCTELLSYFSPTWPTTQTTYSAYSTSTSFVPQFTSTETTFTSTYEYPESTVSVYGSISTDPVIKRRTPRARGNRKRAFKTIKGKYQKPRTAIDVPLPLSGFPNDSISAACVHAVTSPTAYIYETTTYSTVPEFTTTIDSTKVNTKSDILTSAIEATTTVTVPAIGNFKLVHSNLNDRSGSFYGWYINYIEYGIPVKVNAAAADYHEGVTELFYAAYDYPWVTWLMLSGFKSCVYYASIGGTGGAAPTTDSVLNYRLYNSYTYQGGGRAPFLVDYNITSYVGTPAGGTVTGGRFFICETGDAYAAQGFFDLYFGPADFPTKPDYSTYQCQDTGMDAIQGENVCLTSPCT